MQEMNYQKPKRQARKAPPKSARKEAETPEAREEERSLGKMKTQKTCPPLIGRSPNYVERVGLGTLRVISANGLAEEGNA